MKNTSSSPGRAPNIYDVAQAAKVSIAAVSFALNDKAGVSPKTRQRVLNTCRTLGYTPSPSARSLSRNCRGAGGRVTTDLIAFSPVDHSEATAHYPEVLGAITQLATRNRKMLLHQPVQKGFESQLPWINRYGIDGRILIGRVDDSVVNAFGTENAPLLVIGDHECRQPVWNINMDYPAVGRLMVDHLWQLGHRRFLFISSPGQYQYQDEIRRASIERLRENGARAPICLVTENVSSAIPQFEKTMGDPKTRPTAVLAMEFAVTKPVLAHSRKLGMKLPRDFSMLAFGIVNISGSQKVTFVDPCTEESGRLGMELLLRLIGSENQGRPCRTLIPPSITEGETSAPPPMPAGRKSPKIKAS